MKSKKEKTHTSKLKKILIVTVAFIICITGLLLGGVFLVIQPTKGSKIAEYENPQRAVLVIDIQEDYTGKTAKPPFPYKNSDRLIATVNSIIEKASRKNIIIVYVQQEFDGNLGRMISKIFAGGTAIKGNPGTEIDERILNLSNHIFSKTKGDAFSNPKLDEFLIKHQVNEVYIVGLDAEFCVHATATGALNRGYHVNIITDGIALRVEKKWEKLLNQYLQEGIRLMSSEEFLSYL